MKAFNFIALIKAIVGKLRPVDPLEHLLRKGLIVGKNFQMLEDVTIDTCHCWHITIGNDVTLAPKVHILSHDASTKRSLGYTRIGKISIGDRVFIGAGSIILPGVMIGNDVLVGAGSVVSRDIPDGAVVVGNPARIIGTSEEFVGKRKAEMESSPCFGREYTIRGGISDVMKKEMNDKIERYGFVI